MGQDPEFDQLSIKAYATLVAVVWRSPTEVSYGVLRREAKQLATAAALSNDRITLTIGVGWSQVEFELAGQEFKRRGKRADEMLELIRHLDHSYLAVQGPPGTGKTYWGAHLAHSLITAGKRVGVTAFAHKAIDNFMAEVIEVFLGGRVDEGGRVEPLCGSLRRSLRESGACRRRREGSARRIRDMVGFLQGGGLPEQHAGG